MNEKVAFTLFKKTFAHNQHLWGFENIINTDHFTIDLLDEAFDLLGFPSDDECDEPDFALRDSLRSDFWEIEDGTDQEFQSFMDYVKGEAVRMKKVLEGDKKAIEDVPDPWRPGR